MIRRVLLVIVSLALSVWAAPIPSADPGSLSMGETISSETALLLRDDVKVKNRRDDSFVRPRDEVVNPDGSLFSGSDVPLRARDEVVNPDGSLFSGSDVPLKPRDEVVNPDGSLFSGSDVPLRQR